MKLAPLGFALHSLCRLRRRARSTTRLGHFVPSLLALLAGCAPAPSFPARGGEADLRAWSPQEDGPVALEGEWAIWWGALAAPDQLGAIERSVLVPGSWNEVPGPDGPVGPFGAATYRLRVQLPEEPGDLSLRMAGAATAHRIFIDGQERLGGGVVSLAPDQIVPEGTRWIHGLPGASGELELVVQVANAEYRKGGLRRAPLLGTTDQILRVFQRKLMVDSAVVTALVSVGLYQLGLFALRPRQRVHLPFGLMCLAFGARATFSRESQIADMLLPGLSWASTIRLEYALTWLVIVTGAQWVSRMFPQELPRRMFQGLTLAAVAGLAFTGLSPVGAFTSAVWPLQLASVVGMGLVVFTAARAVPAGRDGARLVLISVSACLVGVLWDISVIHTPTAPSNDLTTLTFIGMITAESIRLARDYTRSFEVIEQLGDDLSATNDDLAATNRAIGRFVPTEFLEVLGRSSIREVTRRDHERREMEVLFFDIRSFTPLIESLGPERAFQFINALLAELGPEIRRHGGFVSQYLGDAVLALFYGGADDAVRGGVALMKALERFNRDQGFAPDPIRAGIGMNSGPMMLGVIGSDDRLDAGVVGDPVNLASRMEGMTKIYGTAFLISERTAARLADPGSARLRELDRVRAVGKREAIRIFEVVDALPDARIQQVEAGRERFAAALALYRAGDFAAAERGFAECARDAPLDAPAALYVRRCQALAAAPPAEWEGITELSRK